MNKTKRKNICSPSPQVTMYRGLFSYLGVFGVCFISCSGRAAVQPLEEAG